MIVDSQDLGYYSDLRWMKRDFLTLYSQSSPSQADCDAGGGGSQETSKPRRQLKQPKQKWKMKGVGDAKTSSLDGRDFVRKTESNFKELTKKAFIF